MYEVVIREIFSGTWLVVPFEEKKRDFRTAAFVAKMFASCTNVTGAKVVNVATGEETVIWEWDNIYFW